jgi:nitrile hydratase subunit beta
VSAAFTVGARVRVRAAHPPGHIRTPSYVRGQEGVIESITGAFANPEELAYGRVGTPALPLYRVRFRQSDLWPDYQGASEDTTVIDIYEHWLMPVREASHGT